MLKIVLSSGHGSKISGAVGPSPWGLHEHTEAVRVVDATATELRALGVEVITFEDTISTTQNENLERICSFHNSKTRDYDISVHFNSTPGAHGTEVYHGSPRDLAKTVCDAICAASGLTNRGAKDGSGLYFISNTAKPALLLEICFVDTRSDCDTYRAKFGPITKAIAASLAGQEVPVPQPPDPLPPDPPTPPSGTHNTVSKGDKGPDVVELQTKLGVLIADGDFGSITDTWVRAFQGTCGLGVDGVVGPKTWEQVDALQARVDKGEKPLPQRVVDRIWTMAQTSEIADYSWPGRGVPPPGYIPGIALSFAYAMTLTSEPAMVMSRAQGNPSTDALAWYESEFKVNGMSNTRAGPDCMRHLFVMMMGLGPRESSGRYFEGRDLSASNVASDTAEAGLFQTSWNIRSAQASIGPMLTQFWNNPNGFLQQFKEGLAPTSNNLNSYGGSGSDGLKYQFLARFCPLFHCMVTGVGMRTLRQHWGPINRREVTIKREADTLLQDVQQLMEGEV